MQIAYSRAKNLKEMLCKSKLYKVIPRNLPRTQGWKTCGIHISCNFSSNRKEFKSTATGETFKIKQDIQCDNYNIIYLIECRKCKAQYIGSTVDILRSRIDNHRSKLRNGTNKLYTHFQGRGHSEVDFQFFGIEIVFGDIFILREREWMWISKLDVIKRGLNANRT